MATYKKITYGYVVQEFDHDNNCLGQRFVASDEIEYEDEKGNILLENWDTSPKDLYFPFEMKQPGEL